MIKSSIIKLLQKLKYKKSNNTFILIVLFILYIFCLAKFLSVNIGIKIAEPIGYGNLFYNAISIFLFSFFAKRLFIVLWILITLLYHIHIIYGSINYQFLLIAASTNYSEAFSYLTTIISKHEYFTMALSITFLFFYIKLLNKLYSKYQKSILFSFNLFFSILPFLFFYQSTQIYKSKQLNLYFNNLILAVRDYYNIGNTPTEKDTIKILKNIKTNTNTYVIIMGESNRKDMMSLYGYKEVTTPFLNKVPKKYIDGFISPSDSTSKSIALYFAASKNFKIPNINNNIINIANKAGYKTYYLASNGISINKKDNLNLIARSSHYFFDTSGVGDFILLSYIKDAIYNKEKKLIIIQIMGSHINFCDRLKKDNYPLMYQNYHQVLNCYLSSIHKTDYFISLVYKYLQDSKQNFSLLYLSDHGQTIIKESSNKYNLTRNNSDLNMYSVPFVLMNSNQKVTEIYKIKRSGMHFIDFFAKWIGVETNITNNNFDIFNSPSEQSIKAISYYSKKLININKIESLN